MPKGKRGQASTEYIIIIGIILVLLIPLFWYAWNRASKDVKENQAADCVQSLAQGADEVYSLSPGSKKYITCNVPGSVTAWNVQNKEINMKLSTSGDHVAVTQGDVVQGIDLPTAKGTYRIPVELLDDGTVLIGAEGVAGGPLTITWTWPEDDTETCNPVVLRANTNRGSDCRYGKAGDIDKFGVPIDGTTTYDEFLLDMEGKTLGHHASLGALAEGSYTYWAACKASDGQEDNEDIRFSILFAACGGSTAPPTFELDPPVVTLNSPGTVYPPNGPNIDNTNDITFSYTVNDVSNIILCELLVDNENDRTSNFKVLDFEARDPATGTVPKGVPNIMQATLDAGRYNWTVNCTDGWGNTGEGFFPPPPSTPGLKRYLNFNVTKMLDTVGPAVTLVRPPQYEVMGIPSLDLIYQANDILSGIEVCIANITKYDLPEGFTIITSGMTPQQANCINWADPPVTKPNFRAMDTEVQEGVDEHINVWLDRGCYLWNVYCHDDSFNRNKGRSPSPNDQATAQRWFYQVLPLPGFHFGSGIANSCENYCWQHGFTGSHVGCPDPSACAGDCDSSPAQCTKDRNGNNGDDPDGIWASKEGDLLCQMKGNDPASDTCCCIY